MSCISSFCHFFHSCIISSLLGPSIFLTTLFSHTLSLRPSLSVTDKVSHRYKTTGKITVLCIWNICHPKTPWRCNSDSHTLDFWSCLFYIFQLKEHYMVFRKYCALTFDVYNTEASTVLMLRTQLYVLLCWEAGLLKEPTAFILGAKESLGSHSTKCRCYLLHKIEINANHNWSECVTPGLTIFCQLSKILSHNRKTPAAISYGNPVISVGCQENPSENFFRDLIRLFHKRLRKAPMSFVISVCLSVRQHQNDSNRAFFFLQILFVEFLLIFSSFCYLRLVGQIRQFTWRSVCKTGTDCSLWGTCWGWRKSWTSRLTDGNVQVSAFKEHNL
jgi:hypothetical protein